MSKEEKKLKLKIIDHRIKRIEAENQLNGIRIELLQDQKEKIQKG